MVAHMIRQVVQLLAERRAEWCWHLVRSKGAIHAPEPLITRLRADWEGEMACP